MRMTPYETTWKHFNLLARSSALASILIGASAFAACESDDDVVPGNDAGAPNAGAPTGDAGAPSPGAAGAGGASAGASGAPSDAGAGGVAEAGAGGAGDAAIELGTATRIDPGANEYYSLEGPYWVAEEGYLLFSDVVEKNGADAPVGGPLPKVHQYDPESGVFSVYPYPAAALTSTNGMGMDSLGRLVVTERVNGRVVRVEDDALVELATTWPALNGDPLNAPNDLVIGGNDDIYFSDTLWGSSHPLDLRGNAAYRLAANGTLTRLFTSTSVNGIALSPDARTLYIGNDMDSKVWTLALAANGAPAAGATPVEFLNKSSVPGDRFSVPDGINVDDDGNVYVALNDWSVNAIAVFDPDGTYLGEYAVPVELDEGKDPAVDLGGNGPSNISFGGPDRTTMFITTHHALWQVEVEIPGKP